MSKTTDRTKQWLINALFIKLKTKPYAKITIKDITEQANVARRTFYRLFNNKDEVLDYYCDELFTEYFAFLHEKAKDQLTFRQMLVNFFTFWYEKRDKTRILIQNDLFVPLMLKRTAMTVKVYQSFDVTWHGEVSEQEARYIMDFFVGGYWNLISNWINKKEPEEPAVVAKMLAKALERLAQ
ncbi:TetR/AcrR family transcriptional regulator [Fructilactobacillus carniphilus]|uniref:TetR/AcrR family transcriptional regulator n=1 Tax=Fructilactobacillus carniphilus TaxID=2940297 RepID=A0ABY5BX57_9LACO|nr:TetR/AcrR family transcriptional regulator [Fructilactobacillus carniphilus]USS91089.1 TetR/AcrR family transcriptional regulator [Fructilactobacillus carniphilus]